MSTRFLPSKGQHLCTVGINAAAKGRSQEGHGLTSTGLHPAHCMCVIQYLWRSEVLCVQDAKLNINHGNGSDCTPSRGVGAGEREGPGATQPWSVLCVQLADWELMCFGYFLVTD